MKTFQILYVSETTEKHELLKALQAYGDSVDGLVVISELNNFKTVRAALASVGVRNYREIIHSRNLGTLASLAMASFLVEKEDLLIFTPLDSGNVSTALSSKIVRVASQIAEKGKIALMANDRPSPGCKILNLSPGKLGEVWGNKVFSNDMEKISSGPIYYSGIMLFAAGFFLRELRKKNPEVYYSAKRAFLKRSGSFLNELLEEMVPVKSVDSLILEKSKHVSLVNISNLSKDLSLGRGEGLIGNISGFKLVGSK